MKQTLLILIALFSACTFFAQDSTGVKHKQPQYFINTDLVYDIESIPTIGYERFFEHKGRLRSWKIDAGYQVHYNDSFGVVFSNGDKISVGVYQGPVARVGYSVYSNRHRKKWRNYLAPALGIKYLWYDKEYVHTGRHFMDGSFRIQSEQCTAIVPQLVVGAKHINKHFCADFYAGIQLPVKVRTITVYEERDNHGHENPQVPYTKSMTNTVIAPVLGIKLGYIK